MAKNTVAPVKNIKTAVNPVIKNYQKEQEEAAMNMENMLKNVFGETLKNLTDRIIALEADNKALKARLAALEVASNGIDIPHTEEPVAEATTTESTENKADTTTTENKPAPKTRRKKAAAKTTEKKAAETTTEEVEVTPENTIDYNTMPMPELRAFAASFDIKGRSRAIIIERLNAKNIILVDGEKTATKAAEEATKKADVKPANPDTAAMIENFLKNHKKATKATASTFINDAIKAMGWCRTLKMLKDNFGITEKKLNKEKAVEALKAVCKK